MNPVPAVLQSIRPLTQLPSSLEVSGTNHANNNVMPNQQNNTVDSNNNNNGITASTNRIKALTGANGSAVCSTCYLHRSLQEQCIVLLIKNHIYWHVLLRLSSKFIL